MGQHHRVLVIGGGNAGISLAARLTRKNIGDVAVIEPRETHYFQPLFSHIGAGAAEMAEAVRPQADVMPRGVEWIRDAVTDILPGENAVVLAGGGRVTYDHLVVCPGLQLDWDAVPGLAEAMAGPHGSSNYDAELAPKTWDLVRNLRSGTAVFTQPPGPAKCAGAAQKIAYMACDYWREQGVLQDIAVALVVPTPTAFGMPDVDAELERKMAEYGMTLLTSTTLAAVDADDRTVVLAGPAGEREVPYDLLHVVPPQSAPDWLKNTDLPASGDEGGFVEVDPETLRHRRYPNVWSLGDAAGTTNSKSGGALRKQVKVLAKNLVGALRGQAPQARYDGYSVCPFTLSRGTAFFAEFDDAYRPRPSYPWLKMAKERRWQWVMDRHVLPQVYWHLILKGRA
ncbi:NAD(P)/FAD-dependent oxidoreductase [Arthrobacter halodurans]|uniref:NAD(P)/FAD-dependent oxidoreductase n=1 Tax=Arthrobacter halodurans TaxID=516699 RepID=A0ABV4USC1_9MICC